MQTRDNTDIESLARSLGELERTLALIDRILGRHAMSIGRTGAKRSDVFRQFGVSLIEQIASGISGGAGATPWSSRAPVNATMNPAAPQDSFRMSKGQMFGEIALAIARATRRNL